MAKFGSASSVTIVVLGLFAACVHAPPERLERSKGLTHSEVTPAQAEAAYAPIRYAIVVGVNSSKAHELHPLKYAESDAHAVASVLSDTSIGGFDQVIELQRPSRQALYDALDAAEQVLRPHDLFLFFFSGHGTESIDSALKASLFLLSADTTLADLPATGVSVRDLQEQLTRMKPQRKVLIVDACYNGDGKSGLSAETLARRQQMRGPAENDLRPPPQESEAHLFATAVGQPALEDDSLRSGVYTHYLLQALTEAPVADTNGDGAVSISEAHSYSRDRTMSRTQYRQVPWASYRIVGREDIFLAGQAREHAEKAMVYSFNERFGGARVYVDGQEKGVLPRAFEVSAGDHELRIEAPDGSQLFCRRVEMEPEESVRVDDLEAAVVRSQRTVRRVHLSSAGVAVGLGGAAIITGLHTLSLKTYYETASFETPQQAEAVRNEGAYYRRMTNILLGGSILAAVTSGVVRLRPPKLVLRHLGLQAELHPLATPEGGGVAIAGGF